MCLHLGTPAGSFSLPPLDARRWCDHENGRGRAPRSQQRKEAIVALTRPSASESNRKRLSCMVRSGLQGSAPLYKRRYEWAEPSSKQTGSTADMCQSHAAKPSPLQMTELGKLHLFPHLTGPTVRVDVLCLLREMLLTWLYQSRFKQQILQNRLPVICQVLMVAEPHN